MKKKAAAPKKQASAPKAIPKFPRHSLEKVLRIPKAILDQNAGKECSDQDTAKFLGVKYNKGPYALELSSAIKYGLLERPSQGRIAVSDLAKKILRPQNAQEEITGLREAVLKAPEISPSTATTAERISRTCSSSTTPSSTSSAFRRTRSTNSRIFSSTRSTRPN